MRVIKYLCILCALLMMTGCLSMEQRKEKRNIEKETKIMMLDYLEKNYNIKKIESISAKYSMTGDIANSQFLGTVIGTFQKDRRKYAIICNYNEKKCYDSFAYESKIMPILVADIKENLARHDLKPEYVIVNDKYGFYRYCDDNIYGFFNNNDNVSTFDEINSYYQILGLKLIYKTQSKIFENTISLIEDYCNKKNISIEINVYNNEIISEYLYFRPDDKLYRYYSNQIMSIDNFISYWHVNEISNNDLRRKEQGDFKLELINNNSFLNDTYFDSEIELFSVKYKLYSNSILKVQNLADDDYGHILYIQPNKNVCNSKGVIVYKEDEKYQMILDNYSFRKGIYQTKNFAIYCKK